MSLGGGERVGVWGVKQGWAALIKPASTAASSHTDWVGWGWGWGCWKQSQVSLVPPNFRHVPSPPVLVLVGRGGRGGGTGSAGSRSDCVVLIYFKTQDGMIR